MLVSNNKIFESIKRIVTKIQRIKKLSMVLDESQDSYKKLMNKKTFSEALGLSILGKIFQFLSVYFIFISLLLDSTGISNIFLVSCGFCLVFI